MESFSICLVMADAEDVRVGRRRMCCLLIPPVKVVRSPWSTAVARARTRGGGVRRVIGSSARRQRVLITLGQYYGSGSPPVREAVQEPTPGPGPSPGGKASCGCLDRRFFGCHNSTVALSSQYYVSRLTSNIRSSYTT